MQNKRTRQLAIYGALAAFSAVFQLFHVGVKMQWGMWIDLVGVSWIVAYFLFGFRGGLIVSVVGSIIITLIAPDTWLGASAKLLATVSMFLAPYLMTRFMKIPIAKFEKVQFLALAIALGLVMRSIVMMIFNYYFALTIWVPGKSPVELMAMFPWYIIVGINALQGILEMVLAWLLVFRGKLSRYGNVVGSE